MKFYRNFVSCLYLPIIALTLFQPVRATATPKETTVSFLSAEPLAGTGVWIAPEFKKLTGFVRVTVWFDQQLLGNSNAYNRRINELTHLGRIELRKLSIASLKKISAESHKKAEKDLKELIKKRTIVKLQKHWLINGFSCNLQVEDLNALAKVKGIKKIFLIKSHQSLPTPKASPDVILNPNRPEHVSTKNTPWYVSALKVDQVWKELGITGKGTLNVIHDRNFINTPSLARTIYKNLGETPGNGKDDDGNNLIDDVHGYNFTTNSAILQTAELIGDDSDRKKLHGTSCAHIVAGAAAKDGSPQFGIAPQSRWAGIIADENIEQALEWAIEQGADTYSMSFTKFGLGETRSHWRKLMEHGSYCGVFFVSGAGNHAKKSEIPHQMDVPQSIPEAVFAAAGVQKDLSRTPFSSKGPVVWDTEHYKDGEVRKPEVCAFNFKLPLLMPDNTVKNNSLNGNSYAGPMLCGTIALMVSADPDILPWDLKKIITSTATEIGPKGVDPETGNGLINCYQAVKEVIRRRDLRKNRPQRSP